MEIPSVLHGTVERQDGVFTTAQAVAAGMTGTELGHARATGWVIRIRRGAYTLPARWRGADAEERHRLLVRAVGLQLSAPAVVSHVSAAVLHGLPLVDASLEEVHVTRPGPVSASRHQAGVWHHVGDLDPIVTIGSLDVTDLAQTVFDHSRSSHDRGGLVVADAALARGLTPAALRDFVERHRDHPGSVRAARVAAMADGRSESPGETIARLAFHAIGMGPDELQWDVVTDQGTKRTDFAWTRWGVVVEFDGRVKYGRLLKPGQDVSDVVLAERARELAIERTGWIVERFTWAEIHDLALVRRRLLSAIARARSRGAFAG